MAKRTVLFVINNLQVGGAERSLISLLQELDYEKFEIDLLLFSKTGLFLESVPEQVNILPEPKFYKLFDGQFLKSLRTLNPWIIFQRLRFKYLISKTKTLTQKEQYGWAALKNALPTQRKSYDIAVGYLEKNPIYYVVEKVLAKRKIGVVHSDYLQLELKADIDRPYFGKLTNLIAVSDHCAKVLRDTFPSSKNKVLVIPNITSKKVLERQVLNRNSPFSGNDFTMVSVGRLAYPKGFDVGVEAISRLPQSVKSKLKWFIIGEGPERSVLEEQIKDKGLSNCIVLVGQNPFPSHFVKFADIYFQPSRYEGKSIAIDEAKLLARPILVTNFSTVGDQLEHDKNAWIVEMDPESIKQGILDLYNQPDLREKLSSNLKSFTIDVGAEVDKFQDLFSQ